MIWIHILTGMKMQGYRELLKGNYSREKLLELSRMLKRCSDQSIQIVAEEISKNDKDLAVKAVRLFFSENHCPINESML